MRAFALLVLALLPPLSFVQLPAETARMPLDEVRAGMTGVGVTVFQGSEREEFDVEVLGVLTNVMGPQRNVIVARLSGGPLAHTGVIQGMSGSPVYIDDRLVGAISYSLGSFSKDAIAGITPIEEMVATDRDASHLARRVPRWQLPLTEQSLAETVRAAFGGAPAFASQPGDVHTLGLSLLEGGRLGTLLRPIATPLILGGFSPELFSLWSTALNTGGLVTTIGGSVAAEAQLAVAGQPLQAGDPLGVSLISGDLTMAGTGTVTMVEGDRVYAFGHPFYNLGPSQFPMTRAQVTTLLPSLALSSKIATIGDVIGTIDQDRPTGVYGTIGPGPDLIPVRVTFEQSDRDLERTFSFEIIDDPVFTPLLAYTSVLDTFTNWARELGPRSYIVNGNARVQDHGDVVFGDIYTGDTASFTAASALTTPIAALMANEFEPVKIEAINVRIEALEEPRTATLERVWIDAVRPRAGDVVPVKIVSRTYRGTELLETLQVTIPDHARGALTIQVSDAATLALQERQAGRSVASADTLDQIIRNLNRVRRNSHLYLKLLRAETGAVDRGEQLPGLPGSVFAVLQGNRSSGGLGQLGETTLGEWELPSDHAVTGSRRLSFTIE